MCTIKWLNVLCLLVLLAACRGQPIEPEAVTQPESVTQLEPTQLPTSTATATRMPTATPSATPTLIPTATFPPTPTALPTRLAQSWNSGAIVFMSTDEKALRLIRPHGNRPVDIVRLPAQDSTIISWYSIRPNSNDLIYYIAPKQNYDSSGEPFLLRSGVSRKLNMPSLYGVRWSPDGSKLLGFIYDNKDTTNGSTYVYDFALESGYILPFKRSGEWCPDMSCVIFTRIRITTPNKSPKYTMDIYRYDLLTQQETRLTYLDEAILEFPSGRKGTDEWIIHSPRFLAATQQIVFAGVPEYARPGAGMNTVVWYTVPAAGLPRGSAPRRLVIANKDIAFDDAGTRAIASGLYHNNACSNPGALTLTHLVEQKWVDVLRGFSRPRNEIFHVAGFSWSPDQTQLVFAVSIYSCSERLKFTELQPYRIYTWDATTDANPTIITIPNFVIEGKNPTWIASDVELQ